MRDNIKTFREWPVECPCGFKGGVFGWAHEALHCPTCQTELAAKAASPFNTVYIATDDIPGGIDIRHGAGIINPDGSPKRYYSKTDLKRACNEAGFTIAGDTPLPYKVQWSGKRKKNA